MIGEGPAARSVKIDLPPFTLVGATTRAGMLTNPLRDRFGIVARLEFYTPQELTQIVRHAPAGFARVALDGRFLWANTRLCDLLGAEPVQTLSLNFRDVMIAQDPDWAASQL